MFEPPAADPSDPARAYEALDRSLSSLLGEERDFVANCANLSSLVYHSLPDLNWAGVYILREDELVLGPFQGKPACVRIPLGRGVCGAAARLRETVVVPDVHAFPGHIACDAASRSEIVVPMLASDELVGVLDVDSPVADRFADADRQGLERLVRSLLERSDPPPG